jgi:hypothetical protein
MKEIETILKAMGEGLRSLSKGVSVLADKLDDLVESQGEEKPRTKTPPNRTSQRPRRAPKRKSASKPTKKTTPKKGKTATANEIVYETIKRSRRGVDTATLMEKTGFERRRIQSAVFQLRKQGKIKSVSRGIYAKA